MKVLKSLFFAGMMTALGAQAFPVVVDDLTDTQVGSSTGALFSDIRTQGLGQLVGAASFIDTRTITALRTGGSGLVTTSVIGGQIGIDRGNNTSGVGTITWTTDQAITIDAVSFVLGTDQTGLGNAFFEFFVNLTPVWSHTMTNLSQAFLIPFGATTFNSGTSFMLRNTGAAAADIDGMNFVVNVPGQRIPEPAGPALVGVALLALGLTTRRKAGVQGRAAWQQSAAV